MENEQLLKKKTFRAQENSNSFDYITDKLIVNEKNIDVEETKLALKPRKNKNIVLTHYRGIPPSCNWLNKFSAIYIENDLLYISNNFIVLIDIAKNEFRQLIYSSSSDLKEKYTSLAKVNENLFIACSQKGKFIFYERTIINNEILDQQISRDKILRPIFKERSIFIFENISNPIKFLIYNDDFVFAGDSLGNLFHFVLTISTETTKICFLLFHFVAVSEITQQITDGFLCNNSVYISSSTGCIYEYLISEKEIKKHSLDRKNRFIYSIEYIKFTQDSFLFSLLDKEGTIILYIKRNNSDFFKVFEGKSIFNDRKIQELYTCFVHKIIYEDNEEHFYCIVSSNKGKLFYKKFEIKEILSKIQNSILSLSDFKEMGENTHSMCIFNILFCNNKITCFSSDKSITLWKTPEFIFLNDIKTIGNKPKNIFFNHGSIFLLTEENQFYKYFYQKINGLQVTIRTHFCKHKIISAHQSNFDENIFCFVEQTKGNEINILTINFLYDTVINKMKITSGNIISLIFSSKRIFHEDDIKDSTKEDKINDVHNAIKKNYDKKMISMLDMFSSNEEYELIYILMDNGEFIIWNFVKNISKKIVIFDSKLKKNITSSKIIPLNTKDEDFIVMINSECIEFYLVNQIIFNSLYFIERKTTNLNCLINDYYFDLESNTLLFSYFSENGENSNKLKIIDFSEVLQICNSHNLKENYQEMIMKKKKLNQLFINPNKYIREISINNFTHNKCISIKIRKTEKESNNITFLSEFQDGFIRINEFHFTKINNIINSYKFLILYNFKVHLNSIIDSKFLDSNLIASIGNDHSLKLWNLNTCKNLKLVVDFNDNLNDISKVPTHDVTKNEFKINPNDKMALTLFNKINSLCFYQQSNKQSEEFLFQFEKYYKNLDENNCIIKEDGYLEFYLFSFFESTELNFRNAEKLIEKEIIFSLESNTVKSLYSFILLYQLASNLNIKLATLESKSLKEMINDKLNKLPCSNQVSNSMKYENLLEIMTFVNLNLNISTNIELYKNLIEKFSNLISNKVFLIIINTMMNDYEEAINISLNSNLFIEAIILFKITKSNKFDLFNEILMKFQKYLSQKSIFQALKCQKVIEILNNYNNKIK